MLIVCPSCASEHAVDPDRIGSGGRRVRCASCRESWFVSPQLAAEPELSRPARIDPALPAAAPALVIDAAGPTKAPVRLRGEPKGPGREAPPPKPARPGRSAAAVLAAFALALPSALAARTPIVRAMPESAGLFAAIGLPVNLVGLFVADVSSGLAREGGRPVLVVEGQVRNPGRSVLAVPPLVVTIRGDDGARLYEWPVEADKRELSGGETTRFRARLASPPPAGTRVFVTFEPATPAAVASR